MSGKLPTFAKGYHSCPCRDCFEIAIGGALDEDGEESETEPALCHACEDAGCSAEGDEECCCIPEDDEETGTED